MKRSGFLIVWPSNLDSTKSRRLGRKLSMARAVRQPSVREVAQAAASLGLAHEETERAALPRLHWEKSGYVAVKRNSPRIPTLRLLVIEIIKARQRAAQPAEPGRERR